jgi:hypothetical protein
MKWTRITPQEARRWKQNAIQLARAIVRLQNDDYRFTHSDKTISTAYRVLRGERK